MSSLLFRADLMGRAAITRINTGEPLTLDHAKARMAGFGDGMTKAQLVEVVAYLAARVLSADLAEESAR